MSALVDLSDLVNRQTGGNSGTPENIFFNKSFTIAQVADTWAAGVLYSCWQYEGFPGSGAVPGAVAAPTKATAGALPFTNPGGGREKWLIQAQLITNAPDDIGAVLMYDRLLHIGGLDGTSVAAQTVGGTLTRNTGGVGNQIFIEIYTALGTTARTVTASYTNESGTAGRTTQARAIGGTAGGANTDVNALLSLPLQAGDTGVQSVQSVTISATTGTAGNFGVTVARPLAWIASNDTSAVTSDFTVGPGGRPEIDTDACIAFALLSNSTTERPFHGMISTVEA